MRHGRILEKCRTALFHVVFDSLAAIILIRARDVSRTITSMDRRFPDKMFPGHGLHALLNSPRIILTASLQAPPVDAPYTYISCDWAYGAGIYTLCTWKFLRTTCPGNVCKAINTILCRETTARITEPRTPIALRAFVDFFLRRWLTSYDIGGL